MKITGSTRVFYIIGDPVAQVRAPEVYNQLFEPDTRWRVTKDLPWRLIHLTPLALLGLTRYRHPQYGRLVRVVALFFAVGFLSLLVQRRGWLYHCYPSVPPMLILTMIGLDALVRGPIVSWPRVRWLLSVAALGAVFLRPVLLAGSEVPGAIRDRAAGKPQPLLLADYMARDMAPYVQPGDYVQTLDQVAGGLKDVEPMLNGMPVLLLDGRKVRRRTLNLGFGCHG